MIAKYSSDSPTRCVNGDKLSERRTSGTSRMLSAVVPSLFVLSLVIAGCSNPASKLPVIYSFQGLHAQFVNEDNIPVEFPEKYKGHLFMFDAFYTHCTDVCLETTRSLHVLQDSLKILGIKGVKFVSLTYDPNRDTPPVLKKYAEAQGIRFTDWDFLTGTKTNIDSVLARVKIKYSFEDSSYDKHGKLVYGVLHPDECVLVDGKGRVRGIYAGSDPHFARIIKDIRQLQK